MLVDFKEGTVKEERLLKQELHVMRQLSESPKRWSELEDALLKKNRWFRSKHDLSDTLKRLEEENAIKRVEFSHKNVQYYLTEDFEMLRRVQTEVNKRWKLLPELLKEIREHDEPRKVTFMKTNDLILRSLINYLEGVEGTVRAPHNLRPYARWLLARLTDEFQQILVACGKRDGEATDFVLQRIKDVLFGNTHSKPSRYMGESPKSTEC